MERDGDGKEERRETGRTGREKERREEKMNMIDRSQTLGQSREPESCAELS